MVLAVLEACKKCFWGSPGVLRSCYSTHLKSACRNSVVLRFDLHSRRLFLHCCSMLSLLTCTGQITYCSITVGATANMVVVSGPQISSQAWAQVPADLQQYVQFTWQPWATRR